MWHMYDAARRQGIMNHNETAISQSDYGGHDGLAG